jgi:hypothetical protein
LTNILHSYNIRLHEITKNYYLELLETNIKQFVGMRYTKLFVLKDHFIKPFFQPTQPILKKATTSNINLYHMGIWYLNPCTMGMLAGFYPWMGFTAPSKMLLHYISWTACISHDALL